MLVTKSAIRPGSNFNRQGGSIFHQRQHLNILGVSIAATFELVVTVLAVLELLVFMGVVAPGFSFSNFAVNGWSGASEFSSASIAGIFAAIPFAIWFFLAIEGAAMAAEEAKDPQRTIPRA